MVLYNRAQGYTQTRGLTEGNFSLYLFKGTPPTLAILDTYRHAGNGLLYSSSFISSRIDDLLFKSLVNVPSHATHKNSIVKPEVTELETRKIPQNLSAHTYYKDGTAVWFLLGERGYSLDFGTASYPPTYCIFGTVSDFQGSGDIKMSDNEITAVTDPIYNNLILNYDIQSRMKDVPT